MIDNRISVGNTVLKLQEQFYIFNPNTSSLSIQSNREISQKLQLLYHVLLTKNKEQIQIHATQILECLKSDPNLNKEWGLVWIIEHLKDCTPMEDFRYAEEFNLPFTEEDRQIQYDLREAQFCLYDLTEEEKEEFADLFSILSLYDK